MGVSCPLAAPDTASCAGMHGSLLHMSPHCLWASPGQNQSFRHELLSFAEDGFCCVPVNAHKEKEQEEDDLTGARKNASCST